MDIEQQARQKLENIIRREGDAGGERRKPYYLAALMEELEHAQAVTDYCLQRRAHGEIHCTGHTAQP